MPSEHSCRQDQECLFRDARRECNSPYLQMTSILTTGNRAFCRIEGNISVASRRPLKMITADCKSAQLTLKECEVLHTQKLEAMSSLLLRPAVSRLTSTGDEATYPWRAYSSVIQVATTTRRSKSVTGSRKTVGTTSSLISTPSGALSPASAGKTLCRRRHNAARWCWRSSRQNGWRRLGARRRS